MRLIINHESPNTEVKLFSANGTAWETVWESRTPPDYLSKSPDRVQLPVRAFCILPFFHREFGPEPLLPAAPEGVNIRVSLGHKFSCQTGTCIFTGSGAVENQPAVFWKSVFPGSNICRIRPDSGSDFKFRCGPVSSLADIQYGDCSGVHPGFHGLFGNNGNRIPCYDTRQGPNK
jgi:hypothetical protein